MSKRHISLLFLFLLVFIGSLPWTHVLAEADKTSLDAVYAEVQDALANPTLYDNASFVAFESDYAALGGDLAVEALLNDALAEQATIDAMNDSLVDILSHLTLQTTYVRINTMFWSAEYANPTGYTSRSMTAYNLERVRMASVLGNPRSGETAIAQIEFDLLAAKAALNLLADRSALDAAWTAVQAVAADDEERYTPSSFSAFMDAVAAFATEVIGATGFTVSQIVASDDVSVAEAAAAIAAITFANQILILRADKTDLIAAMDIAKALNLSPFTPNSLSVYQTGLAAIQLVIDDLEASALDVEAAEIALDLLADGLVLIADKNDLVRKNAEVLLAFYEERHLYTASSYQAFKTGVLAYGNYFAVEGMIADLNASEDAVADLLAAMDAALALLVVRGNTAMLALTFTQMNALDLTPYTPASIAAFQTALEAVPAVLLSDDVDQAAVDQTLASVLAFPDLLVLLADKNRLASELDAARSLSRFRYSQAFLLTLDLYIAAGETVLANPNASQSEVDQAYDHLDAMLTNWMLKGTEQSIRANHDAFDIKPLVYLYQTTIVSYASSNPEVLTVDANGIVVGHQFGSATVSVSLANGTVEEIRFRVKADVSTGTILLAAVVPFVVTGMGFLMIFFKPNHLDFMKKIAIFRKKV